MDIMCRRECIAIYGVTRLEHNILTIFGQKVIDEIDIGQNIVHTDDGDIISVSRFVVEDEDDNDYMVIYTEAMLVFTYVGNNHNPETYPTLERQRITKKEYFKRKLSGEIK